MPLDGTGYEVRQNNVPLRSALAHLGVKPIHFDVLEMHKANEIASHPASRLWRYKRIIPIGIAVGSIGSIVCYLAAMCAWWVFLSSVIPPREEPSTNFVLPIGLTMLWMLGSMLLIKMGTYRLLGPPTWIETSIDDVLDADHVPAPIAVLAQHLKQCSPGVTFTIGTLYQDKFRLDPYLLAEQHNPFSGEIDRVCLGIWDGTDIIACATEE